METKENKALMDLKRKMVASQTHINRIYTIISALYEEIQEVKRHTNYKPSIETSTGVLANSSTSTSTTTSTPTNGTSEFAAQKGYGKLKIINN